MKLRKVGLRQRMIATLRMCCVDLDGRAEHRRGFARCPTRAAPANAQPPRPVLLHEAPGDAESRPEIHGADSQATADLLLLPSAHPAIVDRLYRVAT